MMRIPSCAGVILLAIALPGCQTMPGSPPVVVECVQPASQSRAGPALVGQAYGMSMTPIPLNSVQFGSKSVAGQLAVQALFAERSATETVNVTVRFVSCQDTATSIRVRTSFLKASQAPAEPPSAWKTVHVEPRAIAVYSELSTSRDIASYIVEVAQ